MKIIILGAGQVGASVAEGLVSEKNDITMVDYDGERLAQLQDRFDLRTVVGNAAAPSVLRSAGAEDADLLIAVTQSDQANLVACKLAHTVFNVPTRLARLRALDFLDDAELLSTANFAVDFALCPEQVITSIWSPSCGSLRSKRFKRVSKLFASTSENVASNTRASSCSRATCTALCSATIVLPVPADPVTRAGPLYSRSTKCCWSGWRKTIHLSQG